MEIAAIVAQGVSPAQRGRPRAGGPAFVAATDAQEAETTGPAARAGGGIAAAAVSGLAALIALQEAEAAALRDREARRRGQALLAELAAVQRALLTSVTGQPDRASLHRLAALADQVPEAADPALAALVGAIAVRARVELARHGV
jgi:hypothetical protein